MKTIKGFEGEDLEVSDFGEWIGNDYIDYKFEYENNLKVMKELQQENEELKEDIKFCLHSIKQEMELSKDSRTRSEMNDCYQILKGWVK